MANLSAIKLPNGTTYTLKDNGALQLTGGQVTGPVTFGDSVSIDEATIGDLVVNGNVSFVQGIKNNQLVPIQSKVYSDVIASANDQDNGALYFIKIQPDSYYSLWSIRYRVSATINGVSEANGNGYEQSEVYLAGMRDTYSAYEVWNDISNTSYRPYYYHCFYRAKLAGITNNYGHALGINLRYSYNPTTVANSRTVIFEILETQGCTVTLLDAPLKYANWPGTGTTNYNTYTNFDATTYGRTETGDRNDVNYYNRENYSSRTTRNALYRYQLCLTDSTGQLIPINSVNNSIATNKELTTEPFDPFGEIFYWNSTSTYSAGAVVGTGNWYRQFLADLRYSFNCGGYDTTPTLTARSPLYLVATPQTDGTAILYSSPLAETLPNSNDGLIYIYLGRVYEDSKPYRVVLSLNHPVYWYKNGAVRPYIQNAQTINGHTINADVPSSAKFTDTKVNMIARDTTKSYLLGTTTAPTSSNQAVSSVAETGVYFDTTAGTLVATTFKGKLIGNVTGNVSGSAQSVAWSGIASKPTTISGYGITDAKITGGKITLGSNTITPLTSSSTLNAAKLSGIIPGNVTAITQASTNNSTKIATTAYVTTAIANLPEPMIFKGSVGTDGTITSLPTATTENEGWTYKVITALSDPTAKIGDTVISDGSSWVVIPSGTDEKLKVDAITTSGTYYPVLSTDLTTAETKKYDEFFSFAHENGTEAYIGIGKLNTAVGRIRLYTTASGGKYGIITPGTLSATRTYTLPDNTGTIALTSDISPLSSAIDTLNNNCVMPKGSLNASGITDFNDFPLNGIVWANNTNDTFTHAPANTGFHVLTVKPLTTHGFQTALHYGGSIIYSRSLADSVWGDWVKMPTRAEFTTIDDRTKTYIYDQSTGSFLDWVTTTFTNNGEYYIIFATTNYTGWVNSNLGTCLIQKRNADYYLTAFVNDTTITDSQTFYLNKYVGNAWSGWSRMPTRTEMDTLTAAHCNITGIAAGTAPSAFVKSSLENDKLPYDTTFVARFSAGYQFWGTGYFYKASNQVYGSAIVGRPNYIYKVNCYADTWTQEVISSVPSTVTVTASANVVIDTNKSYKCDNTLFLNVKGHATANLSNAWVFTFSGATVSPNSFTFGIPIGDGAWSIGGMTYGYINSQGVVGTIPSGKYFHIAQAFLCE